MAYLTGHYENYPNCCDTSGNRKDSILINYNEKGSQNLLSSLLFEPCKL